MNVAKVLIYTKIIAINVHIAAISSSEVGKSGNISMTILPTIAAIVPIRFMSS